jgi:hypothetical protein
MQDNNQSHRHSPAGEKPPARRTGTGGGAAIPPSVPSITLAAANAAAANAANAAAVAAANPCIPFIAQAAVKAAEAAAVAAANYCVSIEFSFALLGDVLEPVSSTLPAGAATFSADIMPTAVLTPGAKLASPDAVAADVFVATTVTFQVTIGDSQLCFLRFYSNEVNHARLLDGGTHYHREAHRILQ